MGKAPAITEDAVVERMAALQVLSDQPRSARQVEALAREFHGPLPVPRPGDGRPSAGPVMAGESRTDPRERTRLRKGAPLPDVVWRRAFDTRANRDRADVLRGLETAISLFVQRSDIVLGGELRENGAGIQVGLLGRDLPTFAVLATMIGEPDLVMMTVELTGGVDAPARDATVDISLVEGDGVTPDRHLLRVRDDASDAALRVRVAGALAHWLEQARIRAHAAAEQHSGKGKQPMPAGVGDPAPDDALARAARLVAELDELNALWKRQGRFARWLHLRTAVIGRELDRVRQQAASLRAQQPGLPQEVDEQLRARIAESGGFWLEVSRGAARRLLPAPAVRKLGWHLRDPARRTRPSAAGLSVWTARQVTSLITNLPWTIVSGSLEGRLPALTTTNAAVSAARTTLQAWSDYQSTLMYYKRGDITYLPQLPLELVLPPSDADPSHASGPAARREGFTPAQAVLLREFVARNSFSRPALGSMKGNFVEILPANIAAAVLSLAVTGGLTQSIVAGSEGLAVSAAAGVGTSLLNWAGYHANKVDGARYGHVRARSWDQLRDSSVTVAYFRARALLERQERLPDLRPEVAAELRSMRDAAEGLRDQIWAQVEDLVREANKLRRNPLSTGLPTTYDLSQRGAGRYSPNWLNNIIWGGLRHAASGAPALVMANILDSAVNLTGVQFAAWIVAGSVYGWGYTETRNFDAFFGQVADAWDAWHRATKIVAIADYLLQRGEQNAPVRPTFLDEDLDLDHGLPRLLRSENWPQILRQESLAEVIAYRRATRAVGRPPGNSPGLHLLLKYASNVVPYIGTVAAAESGLPMTHGAFTTTMILGASTRLFMGFGDWLYRRVQPFYALFELQGMMAEARTARPLLTVAQESTAAIELAAAANARIQPGRRARAWYRAATDPATVGRKLKSLPSQGRRRTGRLLMRVATRVDQGRRRASGPVLSRGAMPPGGPRLTRRDANKLYRLTELARDLGRATDPGFNARADLDPQRVGEELVVALDELGLRSEQDPDAARWSAAVAYAKAHYQYDLAADPGVARVRGIDAHDATAGPGGPEGSPAQLFHALRTARVADPLLATLWTAVHRIPHDAYRFEARRDGLVKVFPSNGAHRFVLSVSASAIVDRHRAVLWLAPDDLLHVISGTHRSGAHQLTVDDAVLSDSDQLAEALEWAAGQVMTARMPLRRAAALFGSGRDPGYRVLPLAAGPDPGSPTGGPPASARSPVDTSAPVSLRGGRASFADGVRRWLPAMAAAPAVDRARPDGSTSSHRTHQDSIAWTPRRLEQSRGRPTPPVRVRGPLPNATDPDAVAREPGDTHVPANRVEADLRRAYLAGADNAQRRSVLVTASRRADHHVMASLARFATARATTRTDRVDADVLRAVAVAISDNGELMRSSPVQLDPVGRYEWLSTVLGLKRRWPDRASRLAVVTDWLAACTE
jgi:hypothetical protein